MNLFDDFCRFCGAPLPWPRRADMVYCRGGRCCQRHGDAILAEARRAARAGKRCAECGRAFDARRAHAIYCGTACKNRAQRRRAFGSAPGGCPSGCPEPKTKSRPGGRLTLNL